MPGNQLPADSVADPVNVKASGVRFNAGMEDYLKQNVSQLLPHMLRLPLVQGLTSLIDLFNEIAADGLVGLHLIPRTAAGSPEGCHQLYQIIEAIVSLLCKIYHILHTFASINSKFFCFFESF